MQRLSDLLSHKNNTFWEIFKQAALNLWMAKNNLGSCKHLFFCISLKRTKKTVNGGGK